ncbi:MAG TPA: hypothetical protein VK565_07130, partial [Gemmatimonadaceae bacterium]|nr:hypothetical protein [Gemmatimonadaceae bacterium]
MVVSRLSDRRRFFYENCRTARKIARVNTVDSVIGKNLSGDQNAVKIRCLWGPAKKTRRVGALLAFRGESMSRYFSPPFFGSCRNVAAVILAVALHSAFAGETTIDAQTASYDTTASSDLSNPAKNLARMNCGATIEAVGPDGRIVSATNKEAGASALLLDDDTLDYPLPEGDTTFIVTLSRTSTLDRFMFVNEN